MLRSLFRAGPAGALVTVLLPLLLVLVRPAPVAAEPPPPVATYRPPVAAPVVDPFRPPATRFGPGNRGIEYDTVPGTPVLAAAAGRVVFASAVGGRLHATVRHADGIRTTYSYLAEVVVAAGQGVEQGDLIGHAGDTFHFGARLGDAYIDPAVLFASGPAGVVLVPDDEPFPEPAAPAVAAAHLLPRHALPSPIADAGRVLADWRARQGRCTAAATAVPRPSAGRRIAILVGGLGSSSEQAAVAALDTRRLGYADGDVVRFSYRGGRVPGTGADLHGLTDRDYDAADTLGDLNEAADRLAALVEEVESIAPGVRIDLIGHSLGGLVARLAVSRLTHAGGDSGPRIATLVTIGAPHQGVDLASAVGVARSVPGGDVLLDRLRAVLGLEITADAVAVAQMAEGSEVVRALAAARPPPGVSTVSIAARGDPLVVAPRARLPGATNVIVSVDGLFTDHQRLPAAPAVAREIGLALAGRPPTCEGVLDALADAVVGPVLGWAESGFGLVPGAGAAW